MYNVILYQDYGDYQGVGAPVAAVGPFETEAAGDEYFKTNEARLLRVYGSDLTWVTIEVLKYIDLTLRIRPGDKVLCKDVESGCNGKYGAVEYISDKHQVATVNFNGARKIISYNDLEIQL